MPLPLNALLLLALAAPPPAGEDAAHRADRLRTEQLNRGAIGHVERRQAGDRARLRTWQDKQDEYERAMAARRKRNAERRRHNENLR
jgi:hypothetical protein